MRGGEFSRARPRGATRLWMVHALCHCMHATLATQVMAECVRASGGVRYLDVVEGGVVDLVVVREAVDLARLEVDEHVVVAVERVDACGRPHPAPLEVLAADHARVDVRRRQRDRAHLCV